MLCIRFHVFSEFWDLLADSNLQRLISIATACALLCHRYASRAPLCRGTDYSMPFHLETHYVGKTLLVGTKLSSPRHCCHFAILNELDPSIQPGIPVGPCRAGIRGGAPKSRCFKPLVFAPADIKRSDTAKDYQQVRVDATDVHTFLILTHGP